MQEFNPNYYHENFLKPKMELLGMKMENLLKIKKLLSIYELDLLEYFYPQEIPKEIQIAADNLANACKNIEEYVLNFMGEQ